MKTIYTLIILLVIVQINGFAQSPFDPVYKKINPDGSISLYKDNPSLMTVTLILKATLFNVKSSIPLPAIIVVPPSKTPLLLATLTPDFHQPNAYSYNYTCDYDVGEFKGQLPDTTYLYQHPFQKGVPADNTASFPTLNCPTCKDFYRFSTTKVAPVFATREGIVAAIVQDLKNKSPKKVNYIYVAHNDGSYGWYANINNNSATVKIGTHVKQGDLLCYCGDNKKHPFLWFAVLYPSAVISTTAPVNRAHIVFKTSH